MNRRSLLSGAAVVAAYALLPKSARAQAVAPPPRVFPADVAFRQPRSVMAAAARQHSVLDNFVIDTTNNSLNARASMNAPALTDISDIVLAYPGWANSVAGEVDITVASYTVTAAIEYPAGTITPAYFNGSRTLTVTAGRTLARFDPVPLVIPAGAQFWVKSFVQWTTGTFWLSDNAGANFASGVWTSRGIGLTDQTLTTTTFTNTQGSFCPLIYGRLGSKVPVVGIFGDSISVSTGEQGDPVTQAMFMERAMRAQIPVLNMAQNGTGFGTYLARPEGYGLASRDTITHAIVSFIRNDLQGPGAAAIELLAQKVFNQFLRRGVKVWAVTSFPTTTSTDGWATTANQTVADSTKEAQRIIYNAWIRANWQSIGLSGLFDWAHVVDPTDSGKWNADGTTGTRGAGFPTLTGRTISSVAVAPYLIGVGGSSGGVNYPISSTIPCVVRPYPGDSGTGGGVVTATVNSSGVITAFNVTAGGDYDFPPQVAPQGAWTSDGIHGNPRTYNELIWGCNIAPTLFTF